MVAEDIRILWTVSKCCACRRALLHTFARSIVSRASFRRRSRRSTLVSEAPATPPPPNFEPTRFCTKCEFLKSERGVEVPNLEICIAVNCMEADENTQSLPIDDTKIPLLLHSKYTCKGLANV